jgi:hypothetical protein
LNKNIIYNSTNNNIKQLAICSNTFNEKVIVNEPVFTPISHNIINITSLQTYCSSTVVPQLEDEYTKCDNNKKNIKCECMNNLIIAYEYQYEICSKKYNVYRNIFSNIESVTNSFICSAIPTILTTYYNIRTNSITMAFDRKIQFNINLENIPKSINTNFDCSLLSPSSSSLLGKTCLGYIQQKELKDLLILKLSNDASIQLNNELIVNGNVFLSLDETITPTNTINNRPNQNVIVKLDPSLSIHELKPIINLKAPQRLGLCSDLIIDSSLSRGDGGRGFTLYNWNVKAYITSTKQMMKLNSSFTSIFEKFASSTITITSNQIPRDVPITLVVSLELTNFLKLKSNYSIHVGIDTAALPTASITGSTVLEVDRSQFIEIQSVGTSPSCGTNQDKSGMIQEKK